MKLYIDQDYKAHLYNPDGTYTQVDTEFFDDKCNTYIEGYRYIPAGESWTRSDGEIFYGEMITPWRNWRELDNIQREYERQLLAKTQADNADLSAQNDALVNDMAQLIEEVYQSDLEMMAE